MPHFAAQAAKPLKMLFNTIFTAEGGMALCAVIKTFLNVFIKE